MNQRKFLHLLNLYIDGEIPSSEAAELEKEIIANPRRRKIYDDYCRIHRATRLVYERFREAAASPCVESVRLFQDASSHAVAQHESRRWWMSPSWLTLIGGGAAAASIALAFMIGGSDPRVSVTPPDGLAANAASTEAISEEAPADVTFAAPFAAPVRSDPYLAQEPVDRASPFSIDSEAAKPDSTEQEPQVALPVVSTESQISSPFGIVQPDEQAESVEPVLNGLPAKDAADPGRVFRSSNDATPVELEPVGYLIHR
ncbi:MAG: anti-sigma factor family protein [Opitutaceae bacterium]